MKGSCHPKGVATHSLEALLQTDVQKVQWAGIHKPYWFCSYGNEMFTLSCHHLSSACLLTPNADTLSVVKSFWGHLTVWHTISCYCSWLWAPKIVLLRFLVSHRYWLFSFSFKRVRIAHHYTLSLSHVLISVCYLQSNVKPPLVTHYKWANGDIEGWVTFPEFFH